MSTLQQEVSKIISQRLLKGESIALPGFGTLYVERRAARKISATLLEPPFRELNFKSTLEGITLVQEISRVANCSEEQAQDVYERWLEKCREESKLTIEGVGRLSGAAFRVEPSFEELLNPQGHTPIRISRKMPWWVWSLLTIIGVASLTALAVWFVNPLEIWNNYTAKRTTVVEVVEQKQEIDTLSVAEKRDSIVVPVVETPAEPIVETSKPIDTTPADVITRTQSGKSYVVLGIFSTESNARRALDSAVEKGADSSLLRIFFYGNKYLVSIGEYDTRTAAQEAAASCRASGLGESIWVYSK